MFCPSCGKSTRFSSAPEYYCPKCWAELPSLESVVGPEMATEIEEFLSNPRSGTRRGWRPQRHIDIPDDGTEDTESWTREIDS